MERWPNSYRRLPKGWTVENVPLKVFKKWVSAPGEEESVRESMRRNGVPEDAEVISVSESEMTGCVDVFLHPAAAYVFGSWYMNELSKNDPRPRFGVLYAAIYDNGLTKIGMAITGHGSDRLAEHDAVMGLTGAKPIEHIVMECKARSYGAEAKLVEEMAERYEQKRREWFVEVDPEVVRKLMADCIEKDWQERCQSAKVSA